MRVSPILLLLVALSVAPCHAEDPGCLTRTIPVSSFNADRNSPQELLAGDLKGTYEKKQVLVKSVELESTPPRVVLLIDTSTSMAGRIGATVDVAEGVLSRMPDLAPVGLAFFSVTTLPVVMPTLDRKSLIFQLEALRKSPESFRSDTALWSALIRVSKMFETPRAGGAIYLISDAGEDKSLESQVDVQMALTRAGIRLFGLIFETSGFRNRTKAELEGPGQFQKLVDATGGVSIFTLEAASPFPKRAPFLDRDGHATELSLSVSQQLEQLLTFYRVEITLPKAVDNPSRLKMRYSGQWRSVTITYPQFLSPCS